MLRFYSNGKLLISGEYFVLDGASALALPTKFGQDLEVTTSNSGLIAWESYASNGTCWFQTNINIIELLSNSIKESSCAKTNTLVKILRTAQELNPNWLNNSKGVKVKTHLTFPNEWGLGTSSTLINNIASWASVNPYQLLSLSFGGSGYDIACAQHNFPIIYQRDVATPLIKEITFKPTFKSSIFFVYQNQKKDSKEGIRMYRSLAIDKKSLVKEINQLTQLMCVANSLSEFEKLVTTHEHIIAKALGLTPIKDSLFSGFEGSIKSLGAWGGDFLLVTGEEHYVKSYFLKKGYATCLAYDEMIL